uniref:RING-type E3 ubiquitin transferase n=1 Tax=Tetraodon nigroviridis TaxID=99883 RepID=H3D0W3_TETNG
MLSKCDLLSSSAGKHKVRMCQDRDEMKRRNLACSADEEPGVLSDSENEEPISGRIQNMSAFIRKPKAWSGLSSGSQRSQSCTNATDDQGRRWKSATQPLPLDQGAVAHSFAAGILLSSENSGSASALASGERRLTWRAALGSSAAPLALSLPKPERSASPDSNDSISEEFNHFKPIVCSPCTPPKRLPDGRLMEPTIVKSTPRNLSRSLQKATSYEAS